MPAHRASASAGAADFARHCRACHGEDGRGQAGLATILEPAPPDFHAAEAMRDARPIWYYRALTVGIPGSAMQPWDHVLSEDALWDAVFFLWSRSDPPDEREQGARIYAERCADCHGQGGAGVPERRFDDPSRVATSRRDDALALAETHPALDRDLDADAREAILAYLWTFLYEPEPGPDGGAGDSRP
jgi:mono/diheme cytochrome c family protein